MATKNTRTATPEEYALRYGATILQALTDAGITREAAAERTGIPQTSFYRKCRTGRFDTAEQSLIAALLGVTVGDLAARAEVAA